MPGKAVLIAGSAVDASSRGGLGTRSAGRNFVGSPPEGERGNLCGTIRDVLTAERWCRAHDVTIVKSFKESGRQTRRDEVFASIQSLLTEEADFHLIYFAGHGAVLTGDWCFEDRNGTIESYITRADIINALRQTFVDGTRSKDQAPLYIIADCCFSGAWCDLKDLNPAGFHRMMLRFPDEGGPLVWDDAFLEICKRHGYNAPGIQIQASCMADELANETARGGAGTQMIFDLVQPYMKLRRAEATEGMGFSAALSKLREIWGKANQIGSGPHPQHPQVVMTGAGEDGRGYLGNHHSGVHYKECSFQIALIGDDRRVALPRCHVQPAS